MPKLQRDPVTHKILRDPVTHKCMRAGSGESCCCASRCCNAECLRITFTDWLGLQPALSPSYFIVSFLNNGGNPWTLKKWVDLSGTCHFSLDCNISETINGINYIKLMLFVQVNKSFIDNKLTVNYWYGWLVPDNNPVANTLYLNFPVGDLSAKNEGCSETITIAPQGVEDFPGSQAVLELGLDESSCPANEGCVDDNTCDICCPDVTCLRLQASVDATIGGTPLTFVYDFFLARLLDSDNFESCWYYGQCVDGAGGGGSGAFVEAWAHIICDARGIPYLDFFGLFDHGRGAVDWFGPYDVRLALNGDNLPTEAACDSDISPDIDPLINPAWTDVTIGAVTLTPMELCDDVAGCTTMPNPEECPEDCFECAPDCDPVCLFGSVLTIGYTINTGECGDCTCANSIDCCGQCCDDPPVPLSPGAPVPSCASHIVADQAECESHGWHWSCKDSCVEIGGGTTSPCSFTNITGTLAMPWTGTSGSGDEANWSTTVNFGGTVGIVTFNMQFKCSTGRWYFSATWLLGECSAEGDINGNCDSFTSITLNMRDTITGHTCAGGTVGTITFTSLATQTYVCPT